MPDRSFAELSRRSQLVRLRRAAVAALEAHGLGHASLQLVNYEFNASYRVTTADARYALRLNVNSAHGLDEVTAEATWVEAIRADTDLGLARPQRTLDGRLCVDVAVEGHDRRCAAVLYSWIDAPNLGDRPPKRALRAMGQAMATLHDHAERWHPPAAVQRPNLLGVLAGDDDRIAADQQWLDADAHHAVSSARECIDAHLEPVFDGPTHLIHADIHPWNTKWRDGRLFVFDFDDCGIGAPLQDLTIAAYYLRDLPGAEDELLNGFSDTRPLPAVSDAQFEAGVASRNLQLLNSVLGSVTPDMVDFIPEYVDRTVTRLRAYLDTGRFTP